MSHAEPPRDPELRAVEAALAGLVPAAPAVNRDRLLFEAGRRSAARGRAWPLATLGFAVLSGVFAIATFSALLAMYRTKPEVRVVYVPVPASSAEVVEKAPEPPAPERVLAAAGPTFSGNEYLRQRQQVLRWGADALPDPPPDPPGPTVPLESLLGFSRGSRAVGLTQ
jgi:hypothetical protein